MKIHIITYILFAACFLSACRSDNYELIDSACDRSSDELTLTISASDIVVSDGIATRALDKGSSTIFMTGDDVGLIVVDKEGRLLVDNVRYIYNGNDWVFDAEKNIGKERPYYDATMWQYIVYYPYDPSVDGTKDENTLREKPVFDHQTNQSKEREYRYSDLMVWNETGNAMRHLPVDLKHVRNSFSLEVKLNWELGLPSENYLEYHPVREALEDFKVRMISLENDTTVILNNHNDVLYHLPDSTYRYILPDDFYGKIKWRYTYRGESFGGECDVTAGGGVRYVQDTSASVSRDKVEEFDYYSIKKINNDNYGFVLPWDARECYKKYPPVGIVFNVGQHSKDMSDYSQSGIGQEKCHGYVVSILDAFLHDASDPTKDAYKLTWTDKNTPADSVIVTGNTDNHDWSAYNNLVKMREFRGNSQGVDESLFPAAYACEIYTGHDNLAGYPVNTTGWLLPTCSMLAYVMDNNQFNTSFNKIFEDNEDSIHDLTLFNDNIEGYWSSTEHQLFDVVTITLPDSTIEGRMYNRAYYKDVLSGSASPAHKDSRKYVRPFLVF